MAFASSFRTSACSTEPWLDFVEDAIRKAAGNSPVLQLLPPRELAYAVICFYFGVNVMAQLDKDNTRIMSCSSSRTDLLP
jgi:hypothetical protein